MIAKVRGLLHRLRVLIAPESYKREVEEEMRFHLELEAMQQRASGSSAAEAAYAAKRQFGNTTGQRDEVMRKSGLEFFERVGQVVDSLLGTARRLRRSPAYVGISVLSIAVGLGLSTATFAIIDSLVHPRSPFVEPARLFSVRLRLGDQKRKPPAIEQAAALKQLPGVERVGIVNTIFKRTVINGTAGGTRVMYYTPDYIAVLGIRPALGHFPTAAQLREGSSIVVTWYYWRTYLGGGSTFDLRTVTIDDRTYTVVAVLPPAAYSAGSSPFFARTNEYIWIPFAAQGDVASATAAMLLVQLKSGTDSLLLRPQLAVIAGALTSSYVHTGGPGYELQLRGISPKRASFSDDALGLLYLAISVGIFAVACANVTALALARALTRRRDHALRIALGASRARIYAEVFGEVAVISVLGALIGLSIAVVLIGAFRSILPEQLALQGIFVPEFDARAFCASLFALVIGTSIAGGVPAWRASRAAPADPLKNDAGTTTGRRRNEFKYLVIGQLSISMMLLMLTSLVSLSLKNLATFDFGFNARGLIEAEVDLSTRRDTFDLASRVRVQAATLARLRAMPEVASAATFTSAAIDGTEMVSDQRDGVASIPIRRYTEIGAGYFATLGVQLLDGRDVADGDRAAGGAVILSRSAAKALFPRGSALGQRVRLGDARSNSPWITVVGIAPDLPELNAFRVGVEPSPVVYARTTEEPLHDWEFAVRPAVASATLNVLISHTLRDAAPPSAYVGADSWLTRYDEELQFFKFETKTFSILGFAALLLGAAGLFSVLSYVVNLRMREFAVRTALGAQRRDVIRIVMISAFEMALGGTAFGALLSFWASAGMSSMLYGIKNTDPTSLVVAELTLLAVTMGASLVPAYRAARADPLDILRAS